MFSEASGNVSTAIGNSNLASGDSSTAMGTYASTNAQANSFVYSDGSNSLTTNTTDHQFMVRASKGLVFYTSTFDQGTAQSTGVYLSAGGGSWSALSDRNAKDAVQPIDGHDVLDRVVAMPLATWHYKAQDTKYRHMGPMAQDFYAAFHLGESDTGIDTIDADGVALAAIQGLNRKLELEHAALKARVEQLEEKSAEIAALQTAVKALQRDRTAMINTAATP
jgi:trimeric autotransporter adhesin